MPALDDFGKIPLSRKIAAAVVLLAIIGVAYYFARYQTLSSEHDRLLQREETLRQQERSFLQKRDTYEADVRRLAQLREHFASQSRILPPEAEMSSFLDNLNNHGELAGLEISLVQPMDEEAVDFYAKIPVELHLRGRYHELAKFFYNVGQLERVINIENIDLQQAAARQGDEEVVGEVPVRARVLATTFRSLGTEASAPQEGG